MKCSILVRDRLSADANAAIAVLASAATEALTMVTVMIAYGKR